MEVDVDWKDALHQGEVGEVLRYPRYQEEEPHQRDLYIQEIPRQGAGLDEIHELWRGLAAGTCPLSRTLNGDGLLSQ